MVHQMGESKRERLRVDFARRLLGLPARLACDTRGAFAIIFAFMLPLLVSAIGLGVEIGGWYSDVRSLQSAADAAAVAAVFEVRDVSGTVDSSTDLLPRATLEATRNGLDTSNGDTITLNYFDEISPSSYTTDYSTDN